MNEIKTLVTQAFELENSQVPDEETALLQWLSDYVAHLLEHRKEYLMSVLYQMDISEDLVSHALSPLNLAPTNLSLAQLILERQKQRIF
ncbi:MAG: hypothetical protein AAF847_08510, partial [Bacteroidota bacterium]